MGSIHIMDTQIGKTKIFMVPVSLEKLQRSLTNQLAHRQNKLHFNSMVLKPTTILSCPILRLTDKSFFNTNFLIDPTKSF